MEIDELLTPAIQEYIRSQEQAKIKDLALQAFPFDARLRAPVLNQIAARQKARIKLPDWPERDGIIFPAPDLIEQASSAVTAGYKASIAPKGNIFIDLTAGAGSDTLALAANFKQGYAVETVPGTADLLRHNLPLLTDTPVEVITGKAEDVIRDLPPADLVYIDPARRQSGGKKGLYDPAQTEPNVMAMLEQLKQKAEYILIKTSPFLDIAEGLRQLENVSAVHIVEHDKQCKEVLYLINTRELIDNPDIITAVCGGGIKTYNVKRDHIHTGELSYSAPLTYLYEPGPGLMKSGAHGVYAVEKGLSKLAPSTQLYTSDNYIENFMGRTFHINGVHPVDKRALLKVLPGKRANITTRNFPLSPEALRKKLGVRDGGEMTLFACTLDNGDRRLIVCDRA